MAIPGQRCISCGRRITGEFIGKLWHSQRCALLFAERIVISVPGVAELLPPKWRFDTHEKPTIKHRPQPEHVVDDPPDQERPRSCSMCGAPDITEGVRCYGCESYLRDRVIGARVAPLKIRLRYMPCSVCHRRLSSFGTIRRPYCVDCAIRRAEEQLADAARLRREAMK